MIWVITIKRRHGKTAFPYILIRPGTHTFATTRLAIIVTTHRLIGYPNMYYVLEISTTKPTQFRVSVVHGDRDLPPSADFLFIGIYDTPEELTEALEPYLQMEEGGA
jgi:hypothetical protein